MGPVDYVHKLKKKKRFCSKNLSNTRDVFQSIWIRCGLCFCDKIDRKLCNYRHYILWCCAIIFWILFFTIS